MLFHLTRTCGGVFWELPTCESRFISIIWGVGRNILHLTINIRPLEYAKKVKTIFTVSYFQVLWSCIMGVTDRWNPIQGGRFISHYLGSRKEQPAPPDTVHLPRGLQTVDETVLVSVLVFRNMKIIIMMTFEPGHAKMCPIPYANNKGADQPAHWSAPLCSLLR